VRLSRSIGKPPRRRQSPNLKAKVDAGVDFLITQMFYRNADYFAFVGARARSASRCRSSPASCRSPTSRDRTDRQALRRRIPADLQADLDRTRSDEAGARVGIACHPPVSRPPRRRRPGIHFYTLNQSPATSAILRDLRRDYA
jgi:methylenetetrahydrofolate reductase (NADPH)